MHANGVEPGRTRDCLDPWSTVYVHQDGSVSLCCWARSLGNLGQTPLAELLEGDLARQFRTRLLNGEHDEDCSKCPARGTTTTLALRARVQEYLDYERERRELRAHARTLEQDLEQYHLHSETLQKDLAHERGHNETLQRDLVHERGHNATLAKDLRHEKAHTTTLSKNLGHERAHNATLTRDLAHERKHNATITNDLAHERGHNATLAGDLAHERGHARTLEDLVRQQAGHIRTLEAELPPLRAHAKTLERELAHLRAHAATLERIVSSGVIGMWRRGSGALKSLVRPPKPPPPAPVSLRACLEDLRFGEGSIALAGWALAPDLTIERLSLEVDQEPRGDLIRVERPDVAQVFPTLARAHDSGFHGTFPDAPPSASPWRELAVVAWAEGREVGRCEFTVPRDLDVLGAYPPAHLMNRVAHIVEPKLFRLDGLRAAHEVLGVLGRHGLAGRGQMLDWGCGCGRVLVPLAARLPGWTLAGIDVDPEAIAWLGAARPDLELSKVAFEPPTDFVTGRFDVVIGLSVMTHLDGAAQGRWLEELARVLAPGGLALLSVHGARALRIAGDARIAADLAKTGISDSTADDTLAGVLGEKEYRATFQTEVWTRAAWGRHFEVLEWLDGGLGGLQDLVLLRSRARP